MAANVEAGSRGLPQQAGAQEAKPSFVTQVIQWVRQNWSWLRLAITLAAIAIYAMRANAIPELRNPWALAAGVAGLALLWVTVKLDRLGAILFPLLILGALVWIFRWAQNAANLALFIAVIFASTGIFPLTYLAYLGVRAPAQRKRLRDDFRLLGLASETELKDVVDDLFQTVYSSTQFIVFIVLIMVLVICVGISFLAFINSSLVSDFKLQSNPGGLGNGQLNMIFAAFFGAYLFAIQELVRRYNTFDLLPQVYSSIFVRMIVATGIVIIGALFIEEQEKAMPTALVVAFLIGTFPQRGIDWLTKKVSKVFDAQQRESSVRPLTDIIGISRWHEVRLQEMGIDDAQNLATVDIRKLLLTTQFDTQEIVHWIDQAILYVKMGPQLESLRENHIATFYELRSTLINLLRTPPASAQDPNNAALFTAVNELVRDLKLADIGELLRITDPSNYPNFTHIAEYYARSKMVVQQRAAAGTEVIVGSQLPYLAMDIQESGEEKVDVTALKATIEQIEKLLDNKPSDAKLWLALGVHCQRLSKHLTPAEEAERVKASARAKEAYDQAIELEPGFADAYLRRAAHCLDRADYASAIRDSSRALQLNPALAIAYNYRGLAQNALGYEVLALEEFGTALRLNDGFAEVYQNRGTVYNSLERFAEAVEDFRCAYLAGLRTPGLLASWGKALLGQEKFDVAIVKLSEAISYDPAVAIFYADRGFAYWQAKAYLEAQSDLQAAMQLDPKLTSAAVNLGRLWIEQKRFAAAVDTLKSALTQAPDMPDANVLHFHLARAHFFNAQYPEAIENFNKALEIGGDNLDGPSTRLYLALAYKGNKQDDKYGEELQKVISTAPKSSKAYKEAVRLQSAGVNSQ